MKKGLIIGRFQPLHNGHIKLIEDVDLIGLEKIILGIGVSTDDRTGKNPFHYDEIREMWLPELEKLTTPFEIYEIPDINNAPKYAEHVEKITSCNQKNTIIVSGNRYTTDCFTNHDKNYGVYKFDMKVPLGEDYLCATKIRDWIVNEGSWKEYVPESTKKLIEKIGGVEIIKQLHGDADAN